MARCILALALCFVFAVPCVWSRRISQDSQVASAYVAPQPQDDRMSTIFVNGYDYNTNEEAVKKHFEVVGAIKDVHLQSRGAATITYQEPSAATRAVNELHETSLEGQSRHVGVKMYDPDRKRKTERGDRPSGRTIFVIGFDSGTYDIDLMSHFGTVGAIEDHHFLSRRSAVITYVEESAAQQAVKKLDRSTMNGQSRYVEVKLDEPNPNMD